MPKNKIVKTIVTLGPSTNTEKDLRMIKSKGVDFVRINMSHSTIEDLRYFIGLARKVGIPFILDTEGSQIRTGDLVDSSINVTEGDDIKLYKKAIKGDTHAISLRPSHCIDQLEEGDLIHIDFDALILRVSNTKTISDGYISARAMTSGTLGKNKAVVVDSAMGRHLGLSVLSPKDYEAIVVGLEEEVEYIAASFMRSGASVQAVRAATNGKMKIISKIECTDALENLEEIAKKTDMFLLDRGDLSKEIPLEKIPFAQKVVLSTARRYGKEAFVATNFLESMILNQGPTRAEVRDVVTTVLEGASGVVLSAETAVGKYPMKCINMIKKLLHQASLVERPNMYFRVDDRAVNRFGGANYLLDGNVGTSLVSPHGGKLVNRVLRERPSRKYLDSLKRVTVGEDVQMDIEQIAFGVFSPLEGFMGKKDFEGVLNNMRLQNGCVWTVPIILDVSEEQADMISVGEEVALVDDEHDVLAVLHVGEKYTFDKKNMMQKLYGTENEEHPGGRFIQGLNPVLLAGKIDLVRRRKSDSQEHELTPRQVRKLFEERGWSRVVGFHTRNVIHRSHEFIQLKALEEAHCDGLFIHPVVGKKKEGDFHAKYIVESYNTMMKHFYPKNRVVFATYATFSRYAGPREAIFTALCRKNFGCSHFIVGRDHTGVGDFYDPKASHNIFNQFPDLGITPVVFDKVFYSERMGTHVHEQESPVHDEDDKLHISGTEARAMLERGESPPEWFMRPEISDIVIEALKRQEEVFVSKED